MRNLSIILTSLFLLESVYAQNNTYNQRSDFYKACIDSTIVNESFGTFSNGQKIDSLFSGLVTFGGNSPSIFAGGWIHNCASDEFSGKGLIPEPRFQGKPLIMNFKTPVFGVGASVYDDHDGTPLVNRVSLVLKTKTGDSLYINETCDLFGEVGFLGGTSNDSIIQAVWSIDNNDGNLEIDSLSLCYKKELAYRAKEKKQQQLKLYPNPTFGLLKVESNNFLISNIKIYDICGRLILQQQGVGQKNVEVELSGMPEGMYTIEVITIENGLVKNIKQFIIAK